MIHICLFWALWALGFGLRAAWLINKQPTRGWAVFMFLAAITHAAALAFFLSLTLWAYRIQEMLS